MGNESLKFTQQLNSVNNRTTSPRRLLKCTPSFPRNPLFNGSHALNSIPNGGVIVKIGLSTFKIGVPVQVHLFLAS